MVKSKKVLNHCTLINIFRIYIIPNWSAFMVYNVKLVLTGSLCVCLLYVGPILYQMALQDYKIKVKDAFTGKLFHNLLYLFHVAIPDPKDRFFLADLDQNYSPFIRSWIRTLFRGFNISKQGWPSLHEVIFSSKKWKGGKI